MSAVVEQRLIGHLEPVTQPTRTHPDQAVQAPGDRVIRLAAPPPRHPLQHADALEEVVAVRLAQHPLAQIRTFSPALGGHSFNVSAPPRIFATIRVNEFIVQYSAKNRSSTLTNRNMSLPV